MNADQLHAFYVLSTWGCNLFVFWFMLTTVLTLVHLQYPRALPRDLYKYNNIYFVCYGVGLSLAYLLWSVW